jgi:photosystem II stability/assembly factor-like uncharacterized protein
MSGRVAAVDVLLSDKSTFYVGSATGGVFRTTDGGVSYTPVFDEQPVLGIGAVAVFQPNPDRVWVGTGEGNPRNSAGVGDGIFRSLDGGESWERMGLEGSERIHRVLTHPTDPELVYAGVMGPAWSDGEVRGVYRTADGGESWERVLYVDERTGSADLVMDPSNPDRLLAAMWEYRREPWFFTSGGPGSGLFLTEDGGDSWRELGPDDGLPDGDLGRIGLAFAPGMPEVVYALVEAERSVLLRSEDGGRSWSTVSDTPGVNPRPFYYADIRVDPTNENRLYRLHSRIEVSEDGGRTFRQVVPSAIIHGDVHELWIDPADPEHMIMGNDGGIAITWDRGDTWRFVENLTLAQYYRISLDERIPYNVYGGLQDNGSWFGPADVWENKGILNAHWTRVGGGDGFSVFDDPSDERWGWSQSQGGNVQRFDRVTGDRLAVRPVHPDGVPLRFNWNAAAAVDPHDPRVFYLGSQFVHRTRDGGASWEIISPDLTTDDAAKQDPATGGLSQDATGAETHTTLIDISPSPVDDAIIWAGSDDGNVQVTRDDGASWTNTTPKMPDAPSGGWVADIEPSNHAAETAYAVFEEHRKGDWTPWLYRTTDLGASWRRLGEEIQGFIHAVEEDPLEPRLLFAGTEFGLWFSLDAGESWQRWHHVPAVPVRDLEVHARDGDLILGTHGRGIWIVDAIHPLRELAARPELAGRPEAAGEGGENGEDVHLFTAPDTWRHPTAEAIGYRSTGMAMWQGKTRPYGVPVSFWVTPGSSRVGAPVRIRVEDDRGRRVTTLGRPAAAGLNRLWWDLEASDAEEGYPVPDGMEVPPGAYTLSIVGLPGAGRRTVTVHPDPRVEHDSAAWLAGMQERWDAARDAAEMSEVVREARGALRMAREGVEAALSAPAVAAGEADLRTAGRELLESIELAEERLFTGPECQGICAGDPVAGAVGAPLYRLRGGSGAVTELERTLMEQAGEALEEVVTEVNRILQGPVAEFRSRVGSVPAIPAIDPVRLPGGRYRP